MKSVCYIAVDILTGEYDCIADLFIKEDLQEVEEEEDVYSSIAKN